MPTISPQVTPYYGGGQAVNPANVIATSGAPSTKLTENLVGTLAVDNTAQKIYGLVSKSGGVNTWALLGGATGVIDSVVGTANQITATTVGTTVTLSLPSAITTPGSLTTTTSLSSTTTITAGTGITSTTGNIVATAGALNAGTSVTATLGNITATNGNFVLGTAGNKIISTSVATTTTAGANSIGSVTLVSGTATVSTTAVTANSLIVTWRQAIGASTALGQLTVGTITAGTSFVINAATQGTPGTPLAADVSVVGWEIIN